MENDPASRPATPAMTTIELSTAATNDFGSDLSFCQGLAIRAFARHRINGVSERNDASSKRNAISHKTIGISSPIPVLVMMADCRNNLL